MRRASEAPGQERSGRTGASCSRTIEMRRLRASFGSAANSGSASAPADHLGHPPRREAGADHHAAGRVGAIARQTPVVVIAGGERPRIGVATDREPVGQGMHSLGDDAQQPLRVRVHTGAAVRKHRHAFTVDQLDPQALRRALDENAVREGAELLGPLQRLKIASLAVSKRSSVLAAAWLRRSCRPHPRTRGCPTAPPPRLPAGSRRWQARAGPNSGRRARPIERWPPAAAW